MVGWADGFEPNSIQVTIVVCVNYVHILTIMFGFVIYHTRNAF